MFPEVYVSIHNGEGEVLHVGVGGDGNALLFSPFLQLRRLGLPVLAPDVFDGVMQLVGQFQALNGGHGKVLTAVLGTFGGLPPQNHFRVVDEIAVDGKPVLILPNVYPVGQFHLGCVPFLEKQDVRHHVCPGVGTESVVG